MQVDLAYSLGLAETYDGLSAMIKSPEMKVALTKPAYAQLAIP